MAVTQIVSTLADGGRVVIPADYRKALGLTVGDEVILYLEDDEIRLIPRRLALKRAQELVRQYAGPRRLSDELIQERREDAQHE